MNEIGLKALKSGIEDLEKFIASRKSSNVLKPFKFKRELHSSAREIQLHLEVTKGVSAQKPEIKLRERIKR